MNTKMNAIDEFSCSVVIPNLHSPIIDQTIQSLKNQQTDENYEIIVVGMDKHKIIPIDEVTFIKTPHPTPPAKARNIGASIAKGDYILFIDADCIAEANWIQEHINIHKNQENPVLVGGGVSFPDSPYLTLTDNVSTFHEYMMHNPKSERLLLPSLNLSVPKSIWNKLGGFDENFPFASGEDSDFVIRAHCQGYKLIFSPSARVEHLPKRNSLPNIINHAYRFGEFSVKGNKKYWDIISIPWPMKNWALAFVFSPLISIWLILKILFVEKLPIKYWQTIPFIFIYKICWVLGYVKQLRKYG